MIRTQIYLTDSEKKALNTISTETGKKQSELIRQAIDQFIPKFQNHNRLSLLRKAKGMWKNRKDIPDFEKLRKTEYETK